MLSGLKNFLITFCVSVIIFGLIAYFVVGFAVDNILPADNTFPADDYTNVASDTSGYLPEEDEPGIVTDSEGNLTYYELINDSLTILLIGTDYQPDLLNDYDLSVLNADKKGFPYKERIIEADSIMLLHINNEQNKFVICSIPGDMRVTVDGTSVNLKTLLHSKGIDFLKNKITAVTGLKINHYAMISVSNFASIIDDVDGIPFNVPMDMNYEDAAQGLIISLNKGVQRLSGEKALQMLRFNGYPEGTLTRAGLTADFAKAVLNKLATIEYLPKAVSLYQKWIKYVETDFSENDFVDNLDIIFAYPDYSFENINYPGQYENKDGESYFVPEIADAIDMFIKYKK